MEKCWYLILMMMGIAFTLPAQEQEVGRSTVVSRDFKMATLGKKISMLKEKDTAFSLSDIRSLPSGSFKNWKDVNIIFGHIPESLWLNFQLINTDTLPHDLILEVVDPYLFELQFHRELVDGAFASDTLFVFDDFHKRGYFQDNEGDEHRNLQFSFTLEANDTSQCYIYIPASKYSLNVRMHLWDTKYRTGGLEFVETSIFLIFFVICFIYLLILGITIAITDFYYFWWYFFYVLLGAFFVYTDLGLAYKHIWPESSFTQQSSLFIIVNLYLICGTMFVRKYFNTKVMYNKIDIALLAIMSVVLVVIPLSVLMPFIDGIAYSHILSTFINITHIATCVVFFILLILSYFGPQKIFPGIFLFGFSLHGLSIIAGNLQSVGLIPAGSLAGYFMSIGHPLTIHLQLVFMIGMLLEMSVVFYLGFKRFGHIYKQNNLYLKNLAEQKQKTMNALVQGIESERERWSHELHDGLGVKLSLIKQGMEKLNVVINHPEQAEDRLDKIIDELDTAHQDLRDISHNIMPKSLRKLGLQSAIEELMYRIRLVDQELKINFYHNVEFKMLTLFSQLQIYRIVQELLNNMIKHAEAKEVNLQFIQHEGELLITLEDDGRGFNANQALSGGIGLKNIKNRVSVLGGTFLVDSALGRGALISVELPLAVLRGEEPKNNEKII